MLRFIRKNPFTLPRPVLRRLINLWSPFRGAGIKVTYISPDYREIRVSMKLRWSNRNIVGTHFGGSLYAMTDPFYMVILVYNLGPEYIVWDKSACIDFKKPGRGTVHTQFLFTENEINDIRRIADENGKYVFEKTVSISDDSGEQVAHVNKTLYVRKKQIER